MQIKVNSLERVQSAETRTHHGAGGQAITDRSSSFAHILKEAQKSQGLAFSKHARERLEDWGQELGPDKMERLENAVSQASEKGAKSTLVLMKGVAFLVAPKSRTVVTVIPEDRMRENVFTSIDSAVLIQE